MLDIIVYALLGLVVFYTVLFVFKKLVDGFVFVANHTAHHTRTIKREPIVITNNPLATIGLVLVLFPVVFGGTFLIAWLAGAL